MGADLRVMSPRTALPGRPTACRALTWLGIRASRTSAQTSAWRRVTARGVEATVERAASRSPSPRHREVPELAATADAVGIIPNPVAVIRVGGSVLAEQEVGRRAPLHELREPRQGQAPRHRQRSRGGVAERMEPCPHRPDRTHDPLRPERVCNPATRCFVAYRPPAGVVWNPFRASYGGKMAAARAVTHTPCANALAVD